MITESTPQPFKHPRAATTVDQNNKGTSQKVKFRSSCHSPGQVCGPPLNPLSIITLFASRIFRPILGQWFYRRFPGNQLSTPMIGNN